MHTFVKVRQDGGDYLYTVGFWVPGGHNLDPEFNPLRDCGSADEASQWVNYLNGGTGDHHIGRF